MSRRPDGSLRKEVKIKPGYIPQEEQKRFVSGRIKERENVVVGSSRGRNSGGVKSSISNSKPKSDQRNDLSKEVQLNDDMSKDVKLDSIEDKQQQLLKQKRKIIKKLKEIEQLLDGRVLDTDQLVKVEKKQELEVELSKLEVEFSSLDLK